MLILHVITCLSLIPSLRHPAPAILWSNTDASPRRAQPHREVGLDSLLEDLVRMLPGVGGALSPRSLPAGAGHAGLMRCSCLHNAGSVSWPLNPSQVVCGCGRVGVCMGRCVGGCEKYACVCVSTHHPHPPSARSPPFPHSRTRTDQNWVPGQCRCTSSEPAGGSAAARHGRSPCAPRRSRPPSPSSLSLSHSPSLSPTLSLTYDVNRIRSTNIVISCMDCRLSFKELICGPE
jgi:hypothetical protein